jgi:N-acetylmuramoyl-L-alanine amidase
MANPTTYQFNLSPAHRPDLFDLDEKWYPGISPYWNQSSTARIYDPINGVRAVVIHATAGASSSGAVSVITAGKASFHWLVPDENEPQHGQFAWACIPETRAAWHVRNDCHHPDVWDDHPKINHFSLGIEVVNAQTASDPFSGWQIEMTAQIVRYCWAKYPNLRHVVSHAKLDPSRRSDPGTKFDWAKFKELVLHGGAQAPLSDLVAMAASAREVTGTKGGCCMDA